MKIERKKEKQTDRRMKKERQKAKKQKYKQKCVTGWVGGWVDGCKRWFKDCVPAVKNISYNKTLYIEANAKQISSYQHCNCKFNSFIDISS